MKFKIKHRFNGNILFSIEAENFKTALETAIKKHVDLRSADLSYKDLRSSDLRSADLCSSDLRSADLCYSDLRYADLRCVDLRSANLSHTDFRHTNFNSSDLRITDLSYSDLRYADLRSADLCYSDLRYADLRSADLSTTNLRSADLSYVNLDSTDIRTADLRYADLRSADLSSAKKTNKYLSTPLLFLHDQIGKIRAYKLIGKNGEGPYRGGTKYEIGKTYRVDNANTDEFIQCAVGINLATLDWCMKGWKKGYKILIAEFTTKDIAVIPTSTDGSFRVYKCRIVGEKDLKEIGLINNAVH